MAAVKRSIINKFNAESVRWECESLRRKSLSRFLAMMPAEGHAKHEI